MCAYVQLLVFRKHEGPCGSLKRAQRPSVTHRALVWFLPRVSAHVNHQHVLSFEGLLLPRTVLPAAHELLLLSVDVVVIDVLWDTHTHREMRGFSGESCPLRGSHVVPGLMFLWKSILSAEISKEGCSR